MSGGGSCPSPSYGLIEIENKKQPFEKEIKRIIRKQVKQTLTKILHDALIEDKRDDGLKMAAGRNPPVEERMNDSVQFYGFLTNSITKEMDIILGARIEYFPDGNLVFYTVPNKTLFTKFPAPGIYQGPYTTNKKVFVEVIARTTDNLICRAITQLRYLELMSMKGE